MRVRLVTWVLLLNFLNTIFFVEDTVHEHPAGQPVITSLGTLDSVVELLAAMLCEDPTAFEGEQDFDDVPDDLKRGKVLDFFLFPQLPVFSSFTTRAKPTAHPFRERLPSPFFDVFSPPPQG